MKKKGKELKTCNYKMHDGEPCERPLYDDEHCIFHSKDIEGKKEGFNVKFWDDFKRQEKDDRFTAYDFIGFVFPMDISFEKIEFEKTAYFGHATFSGFANFVDATFSEEASFMIATFKRAAYFEDATFSKGVSFLKTTFSIGASFKNAKFSGLADFGGATFSGEAHFGGATFSGRVDFQSATFEVKTMLNNIECLGPINFHSAKFFGLVRNMEYPVNFSHSKFKNTLDLNSVEFGLSSYSPEEIETKYGLESHEINIGKVSFVGIEVDGPAIFDETKLHLKEADFREAKFNNRFEFKIEYIYIEKISMIETYIYDLIGDEGRLEGSTNSNGVTSRGLVEGLDQRNKNHKRFKRKFPFINVRPILKYISEKFAPILGELSEARYPIAARDIKDDRFLMRFKQRHKNWFFLWWLFADCGRSIVRWALWSILFAVVFAFIFHNIFYLADRTTFDPTYIHETWSGFSFIYYSVVTFTTLGFGDIVPKPGWLQFWVMLEVILGYIMLGGLISILANKLARRS